MGNAYCFSVAEPLDEDFAIHLRREDDLLHQRFFVVDSRAFAGKTDPVPIRRKVRMRILAGVRRQSLKGARRSIRIQLKDVVVEGPVAANILRAITIGRKCDRLSVWREYRKVIAPGS